MKGKKEEGNKQTGRENKKEIRELQEKCGYEIRIFFCIFVYKR